ncbi:hypothetical protein PsorP6_006660 [Peronosclerospora sorghi]|uniref:Uncharacterized protein n=1 Tax=Peronosclerospora sorghi TaxID=230839 RepID=A0ACC0W4E0_9STRA|nr:hypothetical protein PsorP6_006660 [Peronosclerospora sorghi]
MYVQIQWQLQKSAHRTDSFLEDSDSDEEPPSASDKEQAPASNAQVGNIPKTTNTTEWYRVLPMSEE